MTEIEHKKIFCGPSKILKNTSWPINIRLKYLITPTETLQPPAPPTHPPPPLMGFHEIKWLHSEESSTVLFYKQYVDGIFCLFKCEADAERFLTFLNRQHPNTKFTIGKEKNNRLPFLDILNDSSSNKLVTSLVCIENLHIPDY